MVSKATITIYLSTWVERKVAKEMDATTAVEAVVPAIVDTQATKMEKLDQEVDLTRQPKMEKKKQNRD